MILSRYECAVFFYEEWDDGSITKKIDGSHGSVSNLSTTFVA